MKRIAVIVGHCGSGKTEFAVNYALMMARQGRQTSLVDLDIVNPYFRSREQQALLEAAGITVYGNSFRREITSDLPAPDPAIRAPLESSEQQVVVDAGGDRAGARILNQYRKYLADPGETEVLFVANGNRPETDSPEKALFHLREIEEELGLGITGLINNTHLLRETTRADLERGMALVEALSAATGIPVRFHCGVEEWVAPPTPSEFFPMTLYLRPAWMDR